MKSCFLFAIAALLFASLAMGFCSVPQPRLVCAEYFASQVVVEATLLGTKTVPDKDDPARPLGFFYELRADRVLRGNIAAQFRIVISFPAAICENRTISISNSSLSFDRASRNA